MFDIKQAQAEHKEWAAYNFPNAEPWEPVMGMAEEAGEACHAALKMRQGIRGTEQEHLHELADALGDEFIYMMDVANKYGLDLETCIQMALAEVKQRDWQKHSKDGVSA